MLTAFLLGAAALAACALGASLVVVALADAAGRETLRLGLGGLDLVAFERTERASATTFGPALVLLPLLGGTLNAVGAAVLQARGGRAS